MVNQGKLVYVENTSDEPVRGVIGEEIFDWPPGGTLHIPASYYKIIRRNGGGTSCPLKSIDPSEGSLAFEETKALDAKRKASDADAAAKIAAKEAKAAENAYLARKKAMEALEIPDEGDGDETQAPAKRGRPKKEDQAKAAE